MMKELKNVGKELQCGCGELMSEIRGDYLSGNDWFDNVPQYECSTCEVIYIEESVKNSCRQQLFLGGLMGSAHE